MTIAPWASQRIDGKPTINGARGLSWKIKDRSDLTLECIRRHYADEESPLSSVLGRYRNYFDLFGSFDAYVRYQFAERAPSQGSFILDDDGQQIVKDIFGDLDFKRK